MDFKQDFSFNRVIIESSSIQHKMPDKSINLFLDIATGNMQAPINTIESDITDPNFNTQRNSSMGRFNAITLVILCLIVAIIAPVATWWLLNR